jgi:hypothetical protein
MKRKLFITTSLLCVGIAAFAYFASIDGKWTGTLVAPDGNEYPLNYTFKADSGKLTGSGVSPTGPVDLTEGKMNGDSISFAMDVNGVKVLNTGKYFTDGDSISLNLDYQGYKMHSTLKRAPADK